MPPTPGMHKAVDPSCKPKTHIVIIHQLSQVIAAPRTNAPGTKSWQSIGSPSLPVPRSRPEVAGRRQQIQQIQVAQPSALQTWAATNVAPTPGPGHNPEIGDRNRGGKHIHQSPRRQVQGHQVFEVGVGGAGKRRGRKGARDPTPALLLVTIKFAS